MSVVGGQNATLSPPISDIVHDRRSSWSGETGGWDSFSAVMQKVDSSVTSASTDGESTPMAAGSRSPAVGPGSSQDSSPETRPISFKRSTGDLRALMTDDAGLITPPSSNLSSPPSPGMHNLPAEPMSPSPSPASTGESSPVRTISSDSTPDLSNIAVDVDPEERGRNTTPNSYKMLSNSYQEFVDPHRLHVILADAAQLDKFCFFQSPAVTPVEEPVYSRPSFLPGMSGHVSPSAYPFYSTTSSNSPRKTATPAQQYDSFQDAFGFPPVAMGNTANTPKASPPPFNDPRAWISQHSPSLAAK